VLAQDPIQRQDFIDLTNKALDALDEIDSISINLQMSQHEKRLTQNTALNQLNVALKRFKRYFPPGPCPEGFKDQCLIYANLLQASLSYELAFNSLDFSSYVKEKKLASEACNKARDLLRSYLNKK
jgi:hypothetical protein